MIEDTPPHLIITSRKQLDTLLREGMESGEAIAVTEEWWTAKRQHLLDKDRPPHSIRLKSSKTN